MTKFGIRYHPDVKTSDLPRINQDIRARIKKAIEERILVAPQEYGTPLRKTLKGYWKLRVGDYHHHCLHCLGNGIPAGQGVVAIVHGLCFFGHGRR